MHRGGRPGRALLGALTLSVVVVAGAPPAPAQDPAPATPPTVDAVGSFAPAAFAYVDCDGEAHMERFTDGGVLLLRTGDLAAELTVSVSYSGSLADDLVAPPTEATFDVDDELAEVIFEIDELQSGDLIVTVEPGPDHVVGDGEIAVEVDEEPDVLADCTTDLGTPPGGTDRQTIRVGEQPEPIGFFDDPDGVPGIDDVGGTDLDLLGWSTPVVGALPPGLTYELDVWGGAATTPGAYDFDVRLCFDEAAQVSPPEVPHADAMTALLRREGRAIPTEMCFGFVDLRIVVEALPPPPVAPPATPVRAPARFAG